MLISKVEMTPLEGGPGSGPHYVEALGPPGNIACLRADFSRRFAASSPHRDSGCAADLRPWRCSGRSSPAHLGRTLRNRTIIPWAFLKLPCCAELRGPERQPTDERSERRTPGQPHLQPQRAVAESAADDQRDRGRHAQHGLGTLDPLSHKPPPSPARGYAISMDVFPDVGRAQCAADRLRGRGAENEQRPAWCLHAAPGS